MGALFHFILGGDARRLALFLLAGWLGFATGHMVGATMRISIFNVGSLHLISAILGALAVLIFTHLLTSERKSRSTFR